MVVKQSMSDHIFPIKYERVAPSVGSDLIQSNTIPAITREAKRDNVTKVLGENLGRIALNQPCKIRS